MYRLLNLGDVSNKFAWMWCGIERGSSLDGGSVYCFSNMATSSNGNEDSSSVCSSSESRGSLGSPSPPASPIVTGSCPSVPSKRAASGPRFKLIQEGDVTVCRLNHTRTIVSKIMNSRYLRRWETHHLILDEGEIRSTTVSSHRQ